MMTLVERPWVWAFSFFSMQHMAALPNTTGDGSHGKQTSGASAAGAQSRSAKGQSQTAATTAHATANQGAQPQGASGGGRLCRRAGAARAGQTGAAPAVEGAGASARAFHLPDALGLDAQGDIPTCAPCRRQNLLARE